MDKSNCSHCGTNSTRLIAGQCPACYARDYRKRSKKTIDCTGCGKTKNTTVTAGICKSCYTAKQRVANPDYQRNWYHKNIEIARKYSSKYAGKNLKSKAAREANRRSVKFKATPTFSDPLAIKNVYLRCPTDKVVDHIIPLSNKDVCGLHVEWNLQYLTKSENSSKCNKIDGTYENSSWRKS